MKRKILFFVIVLCICGLISGCGCGKKDVKPTTTPSPTPKPVLTPLNEKEAEYLYENSSVLYDNTNLPEEYLSDDFDKDGLTNKEEIENNTNFYKPDTDNDGISDHDEINITKTEPTKWSSKGDNVSDLEHVIKSNGVTVGYTTTDISGFKVYITNSDDLMWIISKASTDVFDDLETVSEAYMIKNFSGKIALDCGKYSETVFKNISVYKVSGNTAEKVKTTLESGNLIAFNVEANDIFVAVYTE